MFVVEPSSPLERKFCESRDYSAAFQGPRTVTDTEQVLVYICVEHAWLWKAFPDAPPPQTNVDPPAYTFMACVNNVRFLYPSICQASLILRLKSVLFLARLQTLGGQGLWSIRRTLVGDLTGT